jgi:hypothetical protein
MHKPLESIRGKLEESSATAWSFTRFLIIEVTYQSSLLLNATADDNPLSYT